MKVLFVPIFAVLTVAVYADSYMFPAVRYSDIPMSEVVAVYEVYPVSTGVVTTVSDVVWIDEPSIIPEPYMVAKPVDKTIAVPSSLGPLLPFQGDLPVDQSAGIVRGQAGTESLADILGIPPLAARGAVEESAIDPKLLGSSASSDADSDLPAMSIGGLGSPSHTGLAAGQAWESAPTDPLVYWVLLGATIITTAGLIYMVFVAYDYRQRWLHSSMMQNDRYLGGGTFDMEMDDAYGSSVSLSEGLGLPRRSSI
jgi:hypothetical protein